MVQSPTSKRAQVLLRYEPGTVANVSGGSYVHTIYHKVYGVEAEQRLTAHGVDPAALAHLEPYENPQLGAMMEAYGERSVVMWMYPHVAALNAASSASNRMDSAAISLCCRDIVRAFSWVTLAEFCVFCHRMRTLKYVENRSDYVFGADTVMRGMREFVRDMVFEHRRYDREHAAADKEDGNVMSHEQAVHTAEYAETMKKLCAGRVGDMPVRSVEEVAERVVRKVSKPSMTEGEFTQRRDELLAEMRRKYGLQSK